MSSYFSVAFSFFECGDEHWFPVGVGAPDCMLWRHLVLKSEVPVLMHDFGMVIARREDGPRCGSLSKSYNLACQVVMAFGGMGGLGEGEDENLCVDSFNARLREICFEDVAVDGWEGRVSGEDEGGEHGDSIRKREEAGGKDWWRSVLAEYGGSEDDEEGEAAKAKGKDLFVRDQRWTPLVVKEHGSGKEGMGYVAYGFTMTELLLKAVSEGLRCGARGGAKGGKAGKGWGGEEEVRTRRGLEGARKGNGLATSLVHRWRWW